MRPVVWLPLVGLVACATAHPAPVARLAPVPLLLGATVGRLPGGLEMVVHEDRARKGVVVAVVVRAGSRFDPPGKEGTAVAAAAAMAEAAGDPAVHQATDHDCAVFWIAGDAAEIGLRTRHLVTTLVGPPPGLGSQTSGALAALDRRAAAASPVELALAGLMFPPEHPYARSSLGSPASRGSIVPADLDAFVRDRYGVSRSVLSVVGDVSPAQVTSWLAGFAPGSTVAPPADEAPRVLTTGPEPQVVAMVQPGGRTLLSFGWAFARRPDVDPATLQAAARWIENAAFETFHGTGELLDQRCWIQIAALASILRCDLEPVLESDLPEVLRRATTMLDRDGPLDVVGAGATWLEDVEAPAPRARWLADRVLEGQVAGSDPGRSSLQALLDLSRPAIVTVGAEGPPLASWGEPAVPASEAGIGLSLADPVRSLSSPGGLVVSVARTSTLPVVAIAIGLQNPVDGEGVAGLVLETLATALRSDRPGRAAGLRVRMGRAEPFGGSLVLTAPSGALEVVLAAVARALASADPVSVGWVRNRRRNLHPRLLSRLDRFAGERMSLALFGSTGAASIPAAALRGFDWATAARWLGQARSSGRVSLAIAGDVGAADAAISRWLGPLRVGPAPSRLAPARVYSRRRVEVVPSPAGAISVTLGCRVESPPWQASVAARYAELALAARGIRAQASVRSDERVVLHMRAGASALGHILDGLGEFLVEGTSAIDAALLEQARRDAATARAVALATARGVADGLLWSRGAPFDPGAERATVDLAHVFEPCRRRSHVVVVGEADASRRALAATGFASAP